MWWGRGNKKNRKEEKKGKKNEGGILGKGRGNKGKKREEKKGKEEAKRAESGGIRKMSSEKVRKENIMIK